MQMDITHGQISGPLKHLLQTHGGEGLDELLVVAAELSLANAELLTDLAAMVGACEAEAEAAYAALVVVTERAKERLVGPTALRTERCPHV